MKQVALKAEEAEIEKWKEQAEAEGLGLSAWIRSRCNAPVVQGVIGNTNGPDAMIAPHVPKAALPSMDVNKTTLGLCPHGKELTRFCFDCHGLGK